MGNTSAICGTPSGSAERYASRCAPFVRRTPGMQYANREAPALHVQEWLDTVPAVAVYAVVALVIGVESLGIPLPGEIVLVSAALLSSQHSGINPVVLGACASLGAVAGDSIGYAIGRKGGRPLLAWLAN